MDTLRARPHSNQAGFSLVELLVAVVITLIVTGAIYGLLASSQTAFRRQPELAERQQNIRLAMDLIERDIAAAGQGLPYFAQVFTITDAPGGPCAVAPGLDWCGPGPGPGPRLGTITGAPIDVLEVLSTEEQCPLEAVCDAPAVGAPGVITTNEAIPACMGPLGQIRLVAITDRVFWRIQPATLLGLVACSAGGSFPGNAALNGNVNALAPVALDAAPAALPAATPAWLGAARITRYEVGVDPSDGAPALYRSVTGYFDNGGVAVGGAPQAIGAVPAGTWQLVARGIEDLQVEYLDGSGAPFVGSPAAVGCVGAAPGAPTPPPMGGVCTLAEANTLVRQVRVTLSARSMAAGLQGQTVAAGGAPSAVRGQLQGVTAPRAALIALQVQNQYMR